MVDVDFISSLQAEQLVAGDYLPIDKLLRLPGVLRCGWTRMLCDD
jgi:hypothetical protein